MLAGMSAEAHSSLNIYKYVHFYQSQKQSRFLFLSFKEIMLPSNIWTS